MYNRYDFSVRSYQALRKDRANEISEEDRKQMIIPPKSSNGPWTVLSFVGQTSGYEVKVSQGGLPCKHMYLLGLHTGLKTNYEDDDSDMSEDYEDYSNSDDEDDDYDDPEDVPDIVDEYMDASKALEESHEELLELGQYITSREANKLLKAYNKALETLMDLKEKYAVELSMKDN
ncbi:hypothetical protein PHYBLDRAFT_71169 [Phycomyces blakesleeanus NRRL 1555(-)]|uniref:Uncharacterized protein n=1 Tax=Phycomyces blakesleeanus (strain ATCC 8743b / DSM 1359 / FGSC 10004 / NBRC 33097 / NRRL 1555) TaxID=763407 RepID=A0A167JLH3_PHYB8|nr:hypothetical protein PHYBLDRAFT_71169 [Phycomyces blakesleeanus NRRL 1555(-)]OAD66249.1 hypothetical protein PHYBLDRAFT_71169 [Phycomyces blakesleeanus NRRL 1555(-)]|eukprot:XP_018284289.1 hypothetical protein PHYBLDRAFT_71169 [Phycomyces blakesleeanus NRRL 1555(-)]